MFLFFIISITPNAFADTLNVSGSSHGNEISLDFSDGKVSGIITLEDYTINLSDVRVIERADRMLMSDKQNDLKILSKQIGSDKYLVLVKINSEEIQTKLRFITSPESVQKNIGQRNLLDEMKKLSEEPQQNLDSLTHKERQDLLKQQKIEEIIKQQRETALINKNQGTTGKSILDSFNSAKSTSTGPGLLLKDPNEKKKEIVTPPVDTFDIAAFLSVPHHVEWKKEMIYDVLVTDTSGHRYDAEYKSFIGNELEGVSISGTVKNPSGVVLDEFEGFTANNGKYQNKFYAEENITTVGEYSISITATKYFSDDQLTKVDASDTFFVFPADSDGASNNPPVADAGTDDTFDDVIVNPSPPPTNISNNITLDGSGSSDPEGNSLTYLWTIIDDVGTGITLDDDTSVTPSFDAPDVSVSTDLIFGLVVSDGQLNSSQDTVTITINDSGL